MDLKTYQGSSMVEALEKVKKDLGKNAVILHTRTVKKGGVLGVGGKNLVEITASNDMNLLPPSERRVIIGSQDGRGPSVWPGIQQAGRPVQTYQAEGTAMRCPLRAPQAEGAAMSRTSGAIVEPATREDFSSFTSNLKGEMDALRGMVRQLLDRPTVNFAASAPVPEIPEELQGYYTNLIQNAVAEEIARELISKAKARLGELRARIQSQISEKNRASRRKQGADQQLKIEQRALQQLIPSLLVEIVERMLPEAEPIQLSAGGRTKCVALVGPTGVGKTTTIAKLAAHFKLREQARVGLITIDTYRIAAVDQLQAYADIMGIPLEVVITPEEMSAALTRMNDFDLVLIDTSGRSQKDTQRLLELKAFLDVARNKGSTANSDSQATDGDASDYHADAKRDGGFSGVLETYLVLSCTSQVSLLAEVIEKFKVLGIERVVFTKLDEAVGLGVILNVIGRMNLQLSYLTTGQDVPDDIEVGYRRRIAELVLGPGSQESFPRVRDLTPATSVDQVG